MAPFNALLLQIQKPGLNHAASAHDWKHRFGREIKDKAQPLLILWPFGPVALVYDIPDIEGKELSPDAFAFYANGKIDSERIHAFISLLSKKQIGIKFYNQGDNDAGFIRRLSRNPDKKKYSQYELGLNQNHDAAMSFVTLAHELGHLFLGHLGDDPKLRIKNRQPPHREREIEAESVAYIVCKRNGIECRSQKYLHNFVQNGETTDDLDLYAITRAPGRVEQLLNLSKSARVLERSK